MPQEYSKQARKAMREKDYERAADFYYLDGDFDNALKMYLKAENYELAAKLCEEMKDIPTAIELHQQAENFMKAAELSQMIENYPQAIDFYARAQNFYKAAVLSEKNGDMNRAGEFYSQFGDYINAIRCYIEGHNYQKALDFLQYLVELRRQEIQKLNITEGIDNIIRSYKGKSADLLQRMKRYEEAAALLLQIDDKRKAAHMYSLAGKNDKAFAIYRELGLTYDALEEYEKIKEQLNIDPAILAPLYSRAGNHIMSGELFEKARQYKEAAAEYEKAGEIEKAAQLHSMNNNPIKASEMLLEIGNTKGAVEVLAACGRIKDAAMTAEKHGEYALAAAHYENIRNWGKAAEMYAMVGESQKAVEFYLKLNERKKAFEVYRNNPAAFDNAELIREMAIEEGDYLRAAEISLRMNDKLKAAELFTRSENFLKAAGLYAELNKNQEAADLYLKANEVERAAVFYESAGLYQKAGDCYLNLLKYHKAAECYETAGDFLKAANIFYNFKNLDRTINMLQKIQETDISYKQATFLLGKIFHTQRFYNLAKIKLTNSINKNSVTNENIEAYYILADCHTKLGEYNEAIKLYDSILSYDFSYRDVLRLRELAFKDKSEKKPAGSQFEETGFIRDLLQLQGGDIIAKRFKIDKEIGSGGMGKVYKAFDSELEEDVAIKILFTQFGEYEDEKKNLVNEIKIARKITHPAVIKVYDIGDWLGNKFFTMQYVDGIDLNEWFRRNENVDIKTKMVLFKKICEGIKAAHEIGVIHKDIKPRNILVTKETNPIILDFGIAEAFNAYLKITENKLVGSPDYMSPEQISNLPYDHRTDIYSIGCVIYEMLTGRKPYVSDDLTHLFMAKLDHDPPPPATLNPVIKPDLEKIVIKAMQKNPKNRYSNISELISDINLFLAT